MEEQIRKAVTHAAGIINGNAEYTREFGRVTPEIKEIYKHKDGGHMAEVDFKLETPVKEGFFNLFDMSLPEKESNRLRTLSNKLTEALEQGLTAHNLKRKDNVRHDIPRWNYVTYSLHVEKEGEK